jgi:hypothetical protein
MHASIDFCMHYLAGLGCREFGKRASQDRVTRAPRGAGQVWREICTRVDGQSSDAIESAVVAMVAAAVESLPWWVGTARFKALPNHPGTHSSTCTVTATGESCRASLLADHRGQFLRLDWLLEPGHGPCSWTRHKRRARYRRGRESVRPRHRRSQ